MIVIVGKNMKYDTYHNESTKIRDELLRTISTLKGGVNFTLGDTSLRSDSKDGIGGLIEEWLGVWCQKKGLCIRRPDHGTTQTFPDYYVGHDNHMLEIKSFNDEAGPAFDLANFDSYCLSVSEMPSRVDADYLIFSYKLHDGSLSIEKIWLKKIWEITSPSDRWPLKTQTKKNVIYNIRPATWYAPSPKHCVFGSKQEFIKALFETQKEYSGNTFLEEYEKNIT